MSSQVAKTVESDSIVAPGFSDGDVLRFLNRTLQFHSSDTAKEDVFKKLRNLKDALDRQETTLLSWPDSASKDRIRKSLARARIRLAEIVEQFDSATRQSPVAGDIETA